METNIIYNEDCLEGLKRLPDNSVDCIITDPPYYNIMNTDWKGQKYEWDKFESMEVYINFISKISLECKRVLKGNGSFYMFADDKVCAYIQVELDKYFNLENNITWVKPNNMTIKGWNLFKSYSAITERLLFYSKEINKSGLQSIYENPDLFKSIKTYMRNERESIKKHLNFKTQEEFNVYINKISKTSSVVSLHYFSDSQWVFPTKEIYLKIQTTGFFRREYEELRREYEELRRVFKPKLNYTDVWTFNIIGKKESNIHPTQKPVKLIKRIIDTSSKENDIVLDPFMGSGTTAVACKLLNRNYIGFELDKEYCKVSEERLKNTHYTKPLVNNGLLNW